MNELNLYQKINLIMKENPYIKKGKTVGYGNNSYTAVTHDDVSMKLNPAMVKYGIATNSSLHDTNIEVREVQTKKGPSLRYEVSGTISTTFINSSNPEENFTVQSFAVGFDTQDKAAGKAFSMGVKYNLLRS